jgi:phosphoglycerate kinase
MRTIRRAGNLRDRVVLVRAALNVPVENGKVTNTYRLRQALTTIQYLQKKGAKVVLMGHIGEQGTETFMPVYEALKPLISQIEFCPVSIGAEAKTAISKMKGGEVLLLENLRRHRGEKMNDPAFAQELASLGDVFVEDSFDVCHREHASVVGVPKLLPSYAGFLVEHEVKELKRALKPKYPAIAIIAGAKFATKEPVILALLETYDQVFIGGALANDFIQAEGNGVGMSLTSGGDQREMRRLLKNKDLLIPRDVVVAPLEGTVADSAVVSVNEVPSTKAILDVGPASVEALAPYFKKAKTILWNGTLGRYENGFIEGTRQLAEEIAASKAHSILGGGDTVAAVESLRLQNKFSFVSTGGGAMLDFLAYGKLPGLDALR